MNYHDEYKAKGPGVVTGRSGTIGKVTYVESDYWPHNTSLWVTDFKGNNPKYVYYVYKYIGLSKYASGSGVPTLNRNDVHVCVISIKSCEGVGQHNSAVNRAVQSRVHGFRIRREVDCDVC